MRYRYQTTFDDYRAGMRLYIRSSPKLRIWFHVFYWGFSVIGASLLLTWWLLGQPQGAGWLLVPFGIWLLIPGSLGLALRPWQLRRVYRVSNGEIKPDSVLYLDFDGPTMILGLEGSRETRFERGGICRVIDHESMILLFASKKKFMYLSKTALPPEAFEELNIWLRQPGAPTSC